MRPTRMTIEGQYALTPEQIQGIRDDGIEVRGLMARRSPEPDPGIWLTAGITGHLVVSTAHIRGELLVIVPPPWLEREHIRYRPDREGG